MKTTMRKDRLLKLANFLEKKVKPKWFALHTWAEEGWKEKECGTTACAMGWATVCFPRSKLTISKTGVLKYGNSLNWQAVKKFMQISEGDALYLFSDHSYNYLGTRKDVIERIRQYVKDFGEISHSLREGKNAEPVPDSTC